jgi:hypothetical protein
MDAILSCKVKSTGQAPEIKWMKQISSDEYKNYVHRSNAVAVAAAAAFSEGDSSNMLDISPNIHQSSSYDLQGLNEEHEINLNGLYSMSTISPLAIVAAAANPSDELKSSEDASTSDYDLSKTSLNEIMNENSLNLRIFMPQSSVSSKSKNIELPSSKIKHFKANVADLSEKSVHYITLTSSPLIEQKITYNSDGNYYLSQLTIKNANTKDSGIYVCTNSFGGSRSGSSQSYNSRKSYLRVVSSNAPLNKYSQSLFDLNSNELLKQLGFQQSIRPSVSPSTVPSSASSPFTSSGLQFLYLAIIGLPVLFVCIFAIVSIRYLRLLDEQQKQQRYKTTDKSEKSTVINAFNTQTRSIKSDEKEMRRFCCSLWGLNRRSHSNENYMKNRNTCASDQDTCGTNLLPSTINSLGSSLSDSSSTTNTTVAYYATIPLLLDNSTCNNSTNSPAPPLPNTQPPPFSPPYEQRKTTMSPGVVPVNRSLRQCEIERSGSTPSMAYYKIVDSDLINFNGRVYDEHRSIRSKTENSDEHYYQLATTQHHQ